MAISRGTESKEAQSFKQYVGIAPVFIKAINPDKKQQEELFETQLNDEPNYITETTTQDGATVGNARVSIILQPDTETIGFDMPLITMAIFIQNQPRYNKDKSKVQVIDKYGRTSWATIAEVKAKKVPLDKNGKPLNIDADYRPAYVGEEDLMNFIKAYLCIPEASMWDANTKSWVPNSQVKPEECECRFDNLKNIFKGDFSEIREALGFQPTNKVKVLLGVRTASDGRLYQAVYTRRFMRNSSNSTKALVKEIQDMIDNANLNGRTLSTEYVVGPVHEYTIEATQFPTESSDPLDPSTPDTSNQFTPTESSDDLPWD